MKYKKILIAAILLLAILTVGAVSASEDADVLAQDSDAMLSQNATVNEEITIDEELSSFDNDFEGDTTNNMNNNLPQERLCQDEHPITFTDGEFYLGDGNDEEPEPTLILEVYGNEYMPIDYDDGIVFSIIISGDEKTGTWKPIDELSSVRLRVESGNGEIEFLNVALKDLYYSAIPYSMGIIEHMFTLSELNNFEGLNDGDSIRFYLEVPPFPEDFVEYTVHFEEDGIHLDLESGEDDGDDIFFDVNDRVNLYEGDDFFAALVYHLERFEDLTGGRILVIGGDNVMFDRNVSFADGSDSYEIHLSDLDYVNDLQDDDLIMLGFWSNEGEQLASFVGQCCHDEETLIIEEFYGVECSDMATAYLNHNGEYECNDVLLTFNNYQYYNQTDVIVRINGREVHLDINKLPFGEENAPYCTYSDVGITEPSLHDYDMIVDVTYNNGFTSKLGRQVEIRKIVTLARDDPEFIGDIEVQLRDIDGVSGGNVVATLTDSEGQSFVLFNRSHNDFAYIDGFHHGRYMKGNYITKNDFQINESSRYLVNMKYYDDEGYLLGEDEANVTFTVGKNEVIISDEFSIGVRPVAYLLFNHPIPVGSNVVILVDDMEVYNRTLPLGMEFLSFDLYDYPQFITYNTTFDVTVKFVNEAIGYEEIVSTGQATYITDSGTVEIDVPNNVAVGENLILTVSANRPAYLSEHYRMAIFIDPETIPDFWNYQNEADLFYNREYELENYVWSADKAPINLGSLEEGKHQIYVAYCLDEEWWDDYDLPDFYYGYFNVTVGNDEPIATKLTASKVTTTYNSGKKVTATLKDADGNVISGAKVKVVLGSVTKTLTTNSKGQVSLSTDGLLPKEYTAKFSFAGNEVYAASNANAKVIINKLNADLTAANVTAAYNSGAVITAALKDANGNAIGDAQINVQLGSSNLTAVTDNNGIATVSTDGLNPNTYNANVAFSGNDIYNGVSATATVTINKANTRIDAPDVQVASADQNGALIATLTNGATGKAISGVTVVVNLNGEKYSLKTNSKGQVKVSTASLPIGDYDARISYAGSSKYKSSKATAHVAVTKADLTISAVYNSTNNELVATLTNNATGKAVANVNVDVDINGETSTVKSNSKGQVIVSNLPSGSFTATISYAGNSKYNPASTTVVVSDKTDVIISADYDASNNEIIATLTNAATGKAIANTNLKVSFNGETNTLKTNTKGQVKVSTAGLPLGTYPATFSYAGNSKYNPASTSINVEVKTKVIVTDVYAYSDRIVAKLTNGATGKAIANANMIVEINGVKYNAKSDNKGVLTFDTTGLDLPSAYDLTISYRGNDRYTASSATVAVDLNKANMMITTNYHADKQKMVATLKNSKTGKVVSNANMIIDLNGVKTTYKSNDQGKITLPTADFAPGTYVGTVTYPGNARYNSISAAFKVEI